MPLVKGTTYENVFYDFALDGVKDLLTSEFSGSKVYIAPNILYPDNYQIRIWGTSARTNDWGNDFWQKEYQLEVLVYFIEQNPGENFYKQFYGDAERAYQLLSNNRSKSITVGSTTLVWMNGKVSEMLINEKDEIEEDIDGLHVARLEFSCFIERAQ
tara:strand:- start:1059 stop:1529 length:471 start_codon:yes stop_codon:yes gene_type:complete